MDWWEYLIVVVVGFCAVALIAQWSGWDLTGRQGQDEKKRDFVLGLLIACFLLLLLITYKLFIDPIW